MRFLTCTALAALSAVCLGSAQSPQPAVERDAQRWAQNTLKTMTLEEKVGQVLMPSFESTYTPSDGDVFERLAGYVRNYHVGGFLVFGGSQPAPGVALNPTYASVVLGQPLSAASTVNRLQRVSKLPLITAADFETGVGMRIGGGRSFRGRWRSARPATRRSRSAPA